MNNSLTSFSVWGFLSVHIPEEIHYHLLIDCYWQWTQLSGSGLEQALPPPLVGVVCVLTRTYCKATIWATFFAHTDQHTALPKQNVVKLSTKSHTRLGGLLLVCKEGKHQRKDLHKHTIRSINAGDIMEVHDYTCQLWSAICLVNKVNQTKLKGGEGSEGL